MRQPRAWQRYSAVIATPGNFVHDRSSRIAEAKKLRHAYNVWQAVRHRDVILLTACYFCAMTGSYGIAFWLPTILKHISGKSDLKVTLLAALPYVAAFVTEALA